MHNINSLLIQSMLSKHTSIRLLHWHRRWLNISSTHLSSFVLDGCRVPEIQHDIEIDSLIHENNRLAACNQNCAVEENVTSRTVLPFMYVRKQCCTTKSVSISTQLGVLRTAWQYFPNRRHIHMSSCHFTPYRNNEEDARSSRTTVGSDTRLNRNQAVDKHRSHFVKRYIAGQEIKEDGQEMDVNVTVSKSTNSHGERSIIREIMSSKYEDSYPVWTPSDVATTDIEELPDSWDTSPDLITYEEEDGSIVTEPVEKRLIQPIYTLAPLVNSSELLQKLVRLGVDLSLIEKKGLANDVLKLDVQQHVVPLLNLLTEAGVADTDLGTVLSKCPHLFKEDIIDLKARVNYLRSKKFKAAQISVLITKSPIFLLLSTAGLDAKLGYLQREFTLSGNELRKTVCLATKLLTRDKEHIRINKDRMKMLLCFGNNEVRSIFLAAPRVYLAEPNRFLDAFDYLHRVMGLSHESILVHPDVLATRVRMLETRHRFLLKVGRAQYDPRRENYVSLDALTMRDDTEWCTTVAKATMAEYQQFQKMI